MKRIKKIFINIFLASIVFLMPVFALAVNDFSFDTDVYFSIKTIDTNAPVTVTGKNSGIVTVITTDVNYLDVTLDNGSAVTFTVPSGYYFNVTKQSGMNSYAVAPTCLTNSVTLSATGNVVLRLTVKTTPPSCLGGGGGGGNSGGGGGGGGGGGVIIAPSTIIGSVAINNGALTTLSPSVQVNLSWNNATEVRISEDNQFLNANWRPIASVMSWTFNNNKPGSKTVYVQFKSATSISTVYSYTISLVGEATTEPPTEETITKPTKLLPIGFKENSDCSASRVFVTQMSINSVPSQEIRDLQKLLKCWGYFPGDQEATAIYGPVTELSVRKFQEYHQLTKSGIVDDSTLNKINNLLRPLIAPSYVFVRNLTMGDSGEDVSALQQFLINKDIGPSATALRGFGTTGYFWTLTKDALKEFQSSVGLLADGILNDETISYLNGFDKKEVQIPPQEISSEPLVEGDVIKNTLSNAVYHVKNGKKRLMVNRGTYSSWSNFIGDLPDNFSNLRVVTQENFNIVPFGPNVTVRPGTFLIKFNDSDAIFAVGIDAKLYKVEASVKDLLYLGVKLVVLTDSFRANYFDNSNPVGVIDSSNLIYPPGTLISKAGSSDVYYWDGSVRRLVSDDSFILNNFKEDFVRQVTDLTAYGTVGLPLVNGERVNDL